MLALTKKTEYALMALTHLSQLRQDASGPVSARQIAGQFDLPSPLLMNVLKELTRAKLIRSTRGASGGYELAVDPSRTTLLEVITAVEGPLQLTVCNDASDGMAIIGQSCVHEPNCPIRSPMRKLHNRISAVLSEATLQDLVDDKIESETCQPLVSLGQSSRSF